MRPGRIINQTNVLYLCAVLMDMSVAGVIFGIGRRAAELGANAFELGLLGSSVFGGYSAFAFIGGRISDRLGRRRVAMAGCLSAALLAIACAFITRVNTLVPLCVVFGIAMGAFWPAIIAWLGEGLSGAALSARLSNFSVAWNIGLLLGFALSGLAFERDPRWAFFVSTGAMVGIVVLLAMSKDVPVTANAAGTAATTTAAPPPVPKGRGFRKTAWLANFGINFSQAGAFALFPQLATALGIRADVHGALIALGRFAALVVFVAMQHVHFWRTRLWPLWVAQLVCVAGVAGIGVADRAAWFALLFVVAGAVSGVTYQASIYFTLEEMSEKGKGGGLHESILATGMFLGPIMAGWAGQVAAGHGLSELRVPYFFSAGALVLLIVVQIAVVAWRRWLAAV
jgi:MFS family permease